jgi:hypothetical protein
VTQARCTELITPLLKIIVREESGLERRRRREQREERQKEEQKASRGEIKSDVQKENKAK